MRLLKFGSFVALAIVAACGLAKNAYAQGTVILEGSDAIGLHCTQEGVAGACTYEAQTWKALDGSSAKPIAVIGSVPGISSEGSGITIDDFSTVAGAGTLSQYAALYFTAGYGCCTEDDSLITAAGAQSAVTSYLNGGGTIMIENYIGGSAWDFAVGSTGTTADSGTNSAGYGTNDGAFTCTDGETVTATGVTNGFTQPPAIGCWEHQAYSDAYFGGLTSINGSGFTLSFFNADPTEIGAGYSALLSDGVTLSAPPPTGGSTVPEPSSFALLGTGLVAVVGSLKKKLMRA
jgi:hypothetical protein